MYHCMLFEIGFLFHSLFQDKSVYLLDDPLAAVDAHVARHLFNHCIMGLLAEKTRILCTHHTKYLVDADHVVLMDKGYIIKQGWQITCSYGLLIK